VGRRKHEGTELRVIRKTVCRRKQEIPCGTEFRVFLENTKFRVSAGRRRRHENMESHVSWRKHENPCKSTKTRKPMWRLKNAAIPNNRNLTTCSKTSGTQPELKTSESLDIRKNGEDQRPMHNQILEELSSTRRQTSAPTRRVKNDDSDAEEA
jgi:hypothetical protein